MPRKSGVRPADITARTREARAHATDLRTSLVFISVRANLRLRGTVPANVENCCISPPDRLRRGPTAVGLHGSISRGIYLRRFSTTKNPATETGLLLLGKSKKKHLKRIRQNRLHVCNYQSIVHQSYEKIRQIKYNNPTDHVTNTRTKLRIIHSTKLTHFAILTNRNKNIYE